MATVTFLYSQSVSVSGTKLFNWSNLSNWSTGALPSVTSDVLIEGPNQGGKSFNDVSSLEIHSITFGAGASGLRIGPGSVLRVDNNVFNGSITLEAGAELLEPRTGLSYVTLEGNDALLEQGVPQGYVQFNTNPSISGSFYIHLPQPPSGGHPGFDPQSVSYFAGDDRIYIEEAVSGPLTATYTPGSTISGTLLISSGTTPIYEFTHFNGSAALDYQAVATTVTDPITGTPNVAAIELFVCFARGTRIATPDGERRVESLRAGDTVLIAEHGATRSARIRWVGQRRLDLAAHPRPELAAPIRIRAGALGANLPTRDLLVSPDHALLLDARLVRAKLLVNGMTVVQERAMAAVTYHHVELDDHAVLLAEGVPAESYLDTGNRGFFAGEDIVALHPDLMVDAASTGACAPYARTEAEVAPLWETLAHRALGLGYSLSLPAVTDDPAPRILADGVVLSPLGETRLGWRFAVPAGARSLRLLSRSFVPADTRPCAGDWRRLGVAVGDIVVQSGDTRRRIALDGPELGRGWHAIERAGDATWRWTDGDAALPIGGGENGCVLEIRLHASGQYPVPGDEAPRRVA